MVLEMTVVGYLGGDCTISDVQGKKCVNFSVCHTESYKDAQGVKVDKATWVNVAYWTESTAIAPYLKKGSLVYVKGFPSVSIYQDQSGKAVAQQKLKAFEIKLLPSSKEQ